METAETAILFNIQRFSLHDGGGIRTTFFFKGCPLSCKWCHNPEGQAFDPQEVFFAGRCQYCAHCSGMANVAEGRNNCIYGAREVSGKAYTVNELIYIAQKDAEFYQSSGGGVTLSGGEVLTQPRAFLHSLTSCLKRKGIHVAVDTSGHVPYQAFENVLPFTDIFLYDVKLINSAQHKQFTGHGNELILSNLKKLSDTGAKIEIRVPIIVGVNTNETEIDGIVQYIAHNIRVERVRLLPYHSIGTVKYERIGMVAEHDFSAPSDTQIHEFAQKFTGSGIPTVYS